jgi:hypothetical protein
MCLSAWSTRSHRTREFLAVPEFLIGAKAIAEKLEEFGLLPKGDPNNEDRVYYFDRSGKLKFDRFGDQYLSTPEKLQRQVSKLVT